MPTCFHLFGKQVRACVQNKTSVSHKRLACPLGPPVLPAALGFLKRAAEYTAAQVLFKQFARLYCYAVPKCCTMHGSIYT